MFVFINYLLQKQKEALEKLYRNVRFGKMLAMFGVNHKAHLYHQ